MVTYFKLLNSNPVNSEYSLAPNLGRCEGT